MAEEGIAAHWKYKEGRKGGPAEDDQRIAWLRQLVEWQKGDARSGRVHVHPEGGPVPGGGLRFHAARARDGAAPRRDAHRLRLRDPLRRGPHLRGREGQRPDRAVEVRTAQRRHRRDPDAGRTPAQQGLAGLRQDLPGAQQDQARHQRDRARKGDRDRAEVPGARGAAAWVVAAPGRQGQRWKRWRPSTAAARWRICTRRWATGSSRRGRCCQKLAPDRGAAGDSPETSVPTPAVRATTARPDAKDLVIQVKGVDDLLVYRAKCCNPIRGEPIVGYITRGKGVAVHCIELPQRAEPDV